MKQFEEFLASSNNIQPQAQFEEKTWQKMAILFDRQQHPWWEPHFSWQWSLPLAVCLVIVVIGGVQAKNRFASQVSESDQSLVVNEDTVSSMDRDLNILEEQITTDPVIAEVLNY